MTPLPDHYATLGLDRSCDESDIRAAYRILAKQLHPDLNGSTPDSNSQTQALNAAYETLSDEQRRKDYDAEFFGIREKATGNRTRSRAAITQDVFVNIQDCLRGTKLSVQVKDPENAGVAESYELVIPPQTAPGTKFRIVRESFSGGGFLIARLKVRPDFKFKVRRSDLCCDLKITSQRAAQGGFEMITGANGSKIRVNIPRGVGRNELIRIAGEGLPKPRGGNGDLLVRITYRPEVKFQRLKH